MSRFIFIILWLLIQAAIVKGTQQMAATNTDVIWSEWSHCKIYNVCPHGRRERRRLCDASDLRCVNTNLIQNAKCLVRNCRRETSFESDEKDFTEWSAFTICSATCGEGFKKRTRKCTRSYCAGQTIEQQTCKLADCPVYSNWFDSTPCSKSCGFGIQERTRICLSDSPLCSKEETKMISICKMEKCNNALILSPSRLNDQRIDRVQKDEGEPLSRINDRKIERKKILAITGGTKAPEQSYSIQHSYEENNGIKFLLKPFQYKEHYSLKTLVDASNDHVTTGLTYLVCAILLQIVLYVFTYLYIYKKGCCIKKVHELSFGKNRRRRTFKDTAKFILGQAATNWILRKTKTILKRPPVSNRRNSDDLFNRHQGEYDEEGYLLGQPLRELINEDVEINMDHFDSSILKSSFDAICADIKEDLNGSIIADSTPSTDFQNGDTESHACKHVKTVSLIHIENKKTNGCLSRQNSDLLHTDSQSEQNITSRTSIIDNTELHLCEHVKTVSLIDFGNANIDGCLIRQNNNPLHDSLELDDGNSLDMRDGKYPSHKEPADHHSGFVLCSPPIIKTSTGPPPKDGLNSTTQYGKLDSTCDPMSGSTPFSGTPARDSVNVKTPSKNAGQSIDNPLKESPNFGGDVKEKIKKDLSAKYSIQTMTELTLNKTRNDTHSDDTLKDQNFVKKSDKRKGTPKPDITVKSLGSPPTNNLKIESIDNTLKQAESKKSTRSLQTPTKRSRFSFLRRKNKSADCLVTDPPNKKEKKRRSFFSWFKKNKPSNQDNKHRNTVSRPESNYFVTFKKYTKDFRLDPSPCKDADQCVTKVASCPSLRSISSERLKWESRTRTASLNDLGSDVIKESSRFL